MHQAESEVARHVAGGFGEMTHDVIDAIRAHQPLAGFQGRVSKLESLAGIYAPYVLFRKALKRVEQVSGFGRSAAEAREQRCRVPLIDTELREVAFEALLHDLLEDEVEQVKPSQVSGVVRDVAVKERRRMLELRPAGAFYRLGRVADVPVRNAREERSRPEGFDSEPIRQAFNSPLEAAAQWRFRFHLERSPARRDRRAWRSRDPILDLGSKLRACDLRINCDGCVKASRPGQLISSQIRSQKDGRRPLSRYRRMWLRWTPPDRE